MSWSRNSAFHEKWQIQDRLFPEENLSKAASIKEATPETKVDRRDLEDWYYELDRITRDMHSSALNSKDSERHRELEDIRDQVYRYLR